MKSADLQQSYFDKAIETLSVKDVKQLQLEKLRAMVQYAFGANPGYRRMYESFGVSSGEICSIEDLAKLPIVRKENLVNHYPWGLLSEGVENRIAKVFMSGGTTGRPIVMAYTHAEYDWMVECSARIFSAAGVHGGTASGASIVAHFLPMGSHVAQALYDGAARAGCRVVPAHFRYEEEDRHLQMIQDFGIRALTIAPVGAKGANLQSLLEADRHGVILKQVDAIVCAGAPLPRDMQEDLRSEGKTIVGAYGSTEIGSIGYVSNRCDGLAPGAYHVHADNTIIEIVDEEGNPVAPGTPGYVVATALGAANPTERAIPMIRYLLGDEARLMEGEPCACGRTPIYLVGPKRVLDLPRMQKSCAADW